MIESEMGDTEDVSEDLDEPVVVERAELDDMAEQAEKADNVEEELTEIGRQGRPCRVICSRGGTYKSDMSP